MAEAPATPSSPPLLFGRYRVTEQLGDTRLATVYAATDERLHRRVLLHLLRKELAGQANAHERFVAEIGQMARRSHQALLEVFDSGEVSGRPFMVTEHVSGRPLKGLGLLATEQALLYLRQVVGAVAACQAQRSPEAPAGLYHPPISSSNVLLVDEGRVKLVESWLQPLGAVSADVAHYRAPELSEGAPPVPASAVYALGLLLYELITGVRPVSGADARATALAHLTARIPLLSQSRPTLYLPAAERVLARATARSPEQRFPDAQAFGEALDALWRDLGAATQRLGPAPRRVASAPVQAQAASEAQPTPPPPAPTVVPPSPQRASSTAPTPTQRSGLTNIASQITGRFAGPSGVNSSQLRQRSVARGLVGGLLMLALIAVVVYASYVGANALATRVSEGSGPDVAVPGLPSLPVPQSEGPLDWLRNLFGRDDMYVVNIADGLNMRSAPDATDDSNIIAVIPNNTLVRRLEGPVVQNNIPWLRVRAEVDGQQVEGWMSNNYLKPDE